MAFSSMDDFIAEVTQNGKFWRADWNKITGAAAYTAGRWYDLASLAGTPPPILYGDITINGQFLGNIANWTANGTGFAYGASTMSKTSGTGTTFSSDSTYMSVVAGRFYRVVYTISGYASGSCTVSVGGQAGTARSANGTFSEVITATNTNGIVFTFNLASAVMSLGGISVVEWGASSGSITPAAQILTDTKVQGPIYHGGNVSSDTKHLINLSAVTAVATGAPSVLMLVDMLLVYSYMDANSLSAQTCTNNNTLPRYTDGKGVRAYVVAANTIGAVAHNFLMTYTNAAGTSGRNLPVTVACTASAITPHITHASTAANNFGPFLPLAAGDTGIRSIQSVQLSAASGTAGAAYHVVLCRPLATIPLVSAFVAGERDLVNQLPSLPQVNDGACLSWLLFTGQAVGASTNFFGSIDFAWG